MDKLAIKRTNIPLYVQLEHILKSEIMTGKLVPDERIPTEREIAETYKVSVITARQAILNLVQEGLLIRQQGKGTFVQKQENLANKKNIMNLSVTGDVNNVIPDDLPYPKIEILDMVRMRSSKRLADTLKIPEDHDVMQIRRTRGSNDIIFSYIKNYLPIEIGEKIKKEDLVSSSMLHILKDKLQLPLSRGVQYITAVVADYETASALSVNISSPILYLETTIFDNQDKPIEFVQTFYRSDQFKYTLTIGLNEMRRD